MGHILHGSARTTAAVRRAIQNSEESLRFLAKRYGITPKTVAKWKKRTTVSDQPTGPKAPKSTVLTVEEEALCVAKHTLLPLDDCLSALRLTVPHLTRSSLHRCLRRHGISRLPDIEGDKPATKKFKRYPIGVRRRARTNGAPTPHSTSTSPRSGPLRASCTSPSHSTAPASLPSCG